jgi:Zn-finger nucleic acid-binding protein
MNCPKCAGAELETVTLPLPDRSVAGPGDEKKDLEIDTCPECAGVWFDPDELERFLDSKVKLSVPGLGHASPASLDAKTGPCPRCAVTLDRKPAHYNPNITVDNCAKCGGTWVDGAELDQAGGANLPFADRMKAMFGDIK